MTALERLAGAMRPTSYATGDVIYRQGEPGDTLSDHRRRGGGGQPVDGQPVNRCRSGEGVGEIALLDDRPRTATATAVGPTALLVLTRGGFRTLMMDFPTIEQTVMRALVDRICQLDPAATH